MLPLLLLLLIHTDRPPTPAPPDAPSPFSSLLHWLVYLVALVLLLFLCLLFILCRKRRDDATFGDALTSLDLRTSKLWIGPSQPPSSPPFPSSPSHPPTLSPRSQLHHSTSNHHSLLLLSNFTRSLPHDCAITQPLPDLGHRSRCYRAQLSDAAVDAREGHETPLLASLIGLDALPAPVDYSNLKRFSDIRALLTSLHHPHVDPLLDLHLVQPPGRPHPHYLAITRVYPHGSLRDHLTSALWSHPYASKYWTGETVKAGTPLPMRHVRAFTRQLLLGLRYLRDRGVADYHLHSGNVMLGREGRDVHVRLSGVENNVLGLKGRLHRKVKRMKGVDPVLASLALTVYEMGSGGEAEVKDREPVELTVEGKDTADLNDFLALILHAEHVVTLEELLAHRLCQTGKGDGDGGAGGGGGRMEGKVVRKVLIPVYRYLVLEVYRKSPNTVAATLSYAAEGGWGDGSGEEVAVGERSGGGGKKKKKHRSERGSPHERLTAVV